MNPLDVNVRAHHQCGIVVAVEVGVAQQINNPYP